MKLKDALEQVDAHGCDEAVEVIIQAAKDFQTIIEAREKENVHEEPTYYWKASGSYHMSDDSYDFYKQTYDITSKYIGGE